MKTYKSKVSGLKIVKDTNSPVYESAKITNSSEAAEYMRKFWGDDIEIYESFFLLMLNRAHNVIAYVKISQGGIVGTIVDVKIIGKYMVESLASSAIVAHNHPSGNEKPSGQDITITKRLKDVLTMLDCALLDSLIITANDFYSLADNGDLY